jgi:hypothetical protein
LDELVDEIGKVFKGGRRSHIKMNTSSGWLRVNLRTSSCQDSGDGSMLQIVAPKRDCTITFKPSRQFDIEKCNEACMHDYCISNNTNKYAWK